MKMLKTLIATAALAIFGAGSAVAGPIYTGSGINGLDLADAGVVGTVEGAALSGGIGEEATAAQYLLDLGIGATGPDYTGPREVATNTLYDYAGTITYNPLDSSTFLKVDTGSASVGAGWDYVMAKYDGPNAGYVLFYLGGAATVIPTVPYTLFDGNPNQWGLSHYVAFKGTSTEVPDGGTTAVLLGFGLVGVGFIARRFKTVTA